MQVHGVGNDVIGGGPVNNYGGNTFLFGFFFFFFSGFVVADKTCMAILVWIYWAGGSETRRFASWAPCTILLSEEGPMVKAPTMVQRKSRPLVLFVGRLLLRDRSPSWK